MSGGACQIDLTHLRTWIGQETVVEEVLTSAFAEKFQATLDLDGEAPREGEPAPRLIHFCLCQPAALTSALSLDGHVPRGGFLPPIPLPRRMWAASELRFSGELSIGQAVRRRSRVADVVLKSGKSGDLAFVTIDHRIESDGELKVQELQTLVYRGAQSAGKGAAADPAPEGDIQQPLALSTSLLFRYSALTFNSHRIHYDRPYATEMEGYPGLVVQGPLQATLLFHFAARTAGGVAPDRFTFRSVSPIFDMDEAVLAAGSRVGQKRDLWTARVGGPVAMRAEAVWS